MSFVGKWMDLENIMLSEISQSQKVKGHMFSLICGKLGSKGDTKGTLDNEEETPVGEGRWPREGWGREIINDGITSIEIMYICENINVNLNILFGEEEGVGREPGDSPPSAAWMYVTITMNYVMM